MVAAGVAIAALIVGCGEVSGTAQPVSNELFDPCAVVPDEAIRAAGADPAVVSDHLPGGFASQNFDPCVWSSATYFLSVTSSRLTAEQVVDDLRIVERTPVSLDGRRDAFILRRPDDMGTSPCDIAFPWTQGMIIVNVESKLSAADNADNCERALNAAQIVNTFLPT
ncbi:MULTISPECIES: DUF3558 family protein [unclassified Rhodococcus (in: high G+C Gram-positive bacteria)]|uniref:DUF3558 family protein n=1 Tax=unclassified Rhodococcus (in: high G+C Gram-positive bacteria) TaxID=192944 RepID=UPI000AE52265|nr:MULTISPECIES: DUF3558 family protein [unclassified Rhodococcus (in: high G+C Gram-positive bacteria)]